MNTTCTFYKSIISLPRLVNENSQTLLIIHDSEQEKWKVSADGGNKTQVGVLHRTLGSCIKKLKTFVI